MNQAADRIPCKGFPGAIPMKFILDTTICIYSIKQKHQNDSTSRQPSSLSALAILLTLLFIATDTFDPG